MGRIEARAYCRATEIAERVRSAILFLFPEEIRSTLKTASTQAEGHVGDRIAVITSSLERRRACEQVLTYIFAALTDAERQIVETSLESRLDDQCTLFLRIDKQAAFLGRLQLTTEPDVILLKIHFRDYPKCLREEAANTIIEKLREAGERQT